MWSLIVNDVVVEVTDIDPHDRFHPSFNWIECPSNVEQLWRYDGASFLPPFEKALSLDAFKASLKSSVDAAAETERLKYITAGTGQAMTYQRKVDEAKQLQNDTAPTASNYPLLAASIGIDGANLQAVAAVILGMDAAWAQIGAQIERLRLTAKQAVDVAEDEAAAHAVVNAIVWPSAQQGGTDNE